ncbi:hypothetical protein Egran_06982, partial [Elaphomyces granulatus]
RFSKLIVKQQYIVSQYKLRCSLNFSTQNTAFYMGSKRRHEDVTSSSLSLDGQKRAKTCEDRIANKLPERPDAKLSPNQVVTWLSQLEMLAGELICNSEYVRNHLGETSYDILGAIGELHKAFNRTKGLPSHVSTAENAQNATTSCGFQLTSLTGPARRVPQLPPILDITLEKAVFTHPGVTKDQNMGFPGSLSYDRLEILGDAYIELIATKLIWNRFHNLPSGQISQIREGLVKNETLAEYATMYGFDRKALVPKDHLTQTKRSVKTKGDIFEAYVAAIILSDKTNGYQTAEGWLSELWMPKLTEAAPRKQRLQSKESLARKIMSRGVRLEYVDEKLPVIQKGGTQIFAVGVYLTGWGWNNHHLGSGQGPSKAIAGDQAAYQALLNKSFIDGLVEIKNAHDSQVKKGHQCNR